MLLTPELIVKIEEAFAAQGLGICGDEAKLTLDLLEDFKNARKNYNEAGFCLKDSDTVFHCEKVQVNRNQSRKDLCVIDFGDFRVVYN